MEIMFINIDSTGLHEEYSPKQTVQTKPHPARIKFIHPSCQHQKNIILIPSHYSLFPEIQSCMASFSVLASVLVLSAPPITLLTNS